MKAVRWQPDPVGQSIREVGDAVVDYNYVLVTAAGGQDLKTLHVEVVI